MSYNCKICRSDDRKKIERLLLSKASYKSIVEKFKISYPVIKNHEKYHMSAEESRTMVANMDELKVAELDPARELPQLEKLENCISYVYNQFLAIHLRAMASGDERLNMAALRNVIDTISVIVRGKEMAFAHKSQASWNKVLPFILQAVKGMPEARDAISYAIDKAKTKLEGQDLL